MTARFIVGDVHEVLATLEDGSVDLILTSPPFLALRSYLPADHPDKSKEIGSEATPGAFIDTLLALTEEWARVLAPHGSLCVELGDTYSGSTADGGDNRGNERYPNGRSFVHGQRNRSEGWPQAKSLCLIPELYRVALVYGFNPLTGRTTPRWRARNVVRWCRPNPPVGALGDKFRPGTSEMVVACKSARRWFDLDAVRTEWARDYDREDPTKMGDREFNRNGTVDSERSIMANPAGAPPLDHWLIPTAPYKGSHYATFPPALCVTPIEAMCPRRVCVTCGKPSERIVGDAEYVQNGRQVEPHVWQSGIADAGAHSLKKDGATTRVNPTLGWSDCGHDNWRPGVVLDPFAGSGTVLQVATGHGRDAIGIDLDARNADLARERVGMFLEVEQPEPV